MDTHVDFYTRGYTANIENDETHEIVDEKSLRFVSELKLSEVKYSLNPSYLYVCSYWKLEYKRNNIKNNLNKFTVNINFSKELRIYWILLYFINVSIFIFSVYE